MASRLPIPRQALAEYCAAHGIVRLALFGSVLRDDFGPDSDVDILVEFAAGATPGLLGQARMERELSELLGRTVDLRTPQDLSRHFREQVLARAEVEYRAQPDTQRCVACLMAPVRSPCLLSACSTGSSS